MHYNSSRERDVCASYVEYPYKIYMKHFWSTTLRKLYLLAVDWMLPLGTQCWSYFQFFCFGNVESVSISWQHFRKNTSKAIETRQRSKRPFIRMPSHIENSNKKLFCWSHFVYIPFWVHVYVCVCESVCFTHNILLEDTLQGIIWKNKLKTLVPLQNILLCHLMLVVLQVQRSREKERQNGCKKTMSEQEKQFTRIVYNSTQCPMHSILNIFSYAKYFSVAVVFFVERWHLRKLDH